MKHLLDTHTILWALFKPEKLPKSHKLIIENNIKECCVSTITFIEISIKYGLGKLNFGILTPKDVYEELVKLGFSIIELKSYDMLDFHTLTQTTHKDPFDRMLVWQAIKNNLTLLSKDSKLEVYKPYGLKIET